MAPAKTPAAAPARPRARQASPATPANGIANVAPRNARAGQGQALRPEVLPRLGGGIKVRATKVCYYDNMRRRIGDVFTISDEKFPSGPRQGQVKEFSSKYMELVDARTPEKITTGAEVLKQAHDEILGGRKIETDAPAPRALGTGDDPAINEDDDNDA